MISGLTCNIKDKTLSAPRVPPDTGISVSETCVPPYCQFLSAVRAKIRKKLTWGRWESWVRRQICADMNGLQVFFFFLLFKGGGRQTDRERERVGEVLS